MLSSDQQTFLNNIVDGKVEIRRDDIGIARCFLIDHIRKTSIDITDLREAILKRAMFEHADTIKHTLYHFNFIYMQGRVGVAAIVILIIMIKKVFYT